MRLLFIIFCFTFSHHSFANNYADKLAASFEASKCKLTAPVNFGNQAPNTMEETCYVHDNALYAENIIGTHMIEALREYKVDKVFLNSPGGGTQHAIIAAGLIREKGIETHILEGSYCGSSCTLVFQAGVKRIAHSSAKILYHCLGNGGLSLKLFKQSCGSDLNTLSQDCITRLNEAITASIEETKRHFENYNDFGAAGLFELLMNQDDYEEWFETANFCKKREIFSPEELIHHKVVTQITY